MLSREQEQSLGRKIAQGDKGARDTLFKENMALAHSIAKGYSKYVNDFEDILQEAYVGLLFAVDKYDPEMGFKFSTYATWWIRQRVAQHAKTDTLTVKAPPNVIGNSTKVFKTIESFVEEFGKQPTVAEIADFLEIKASDVEAAMSLISARNSISIYEGENPVSEKIPTGSLAQDEMCDILKITESVFAAVDSLPQNNKIALRERFSL